MPGYRTYDDAIEATVSRAQAQREIFNHSGRDHAACDAAWATFIADHGDHATYSGRTVLEWLGY